MIKLRGHRYRALHREALTPQQKTLKRQYLLEQQQVGDKIPTFEEAWEYVQRESDVVDNLLDEFDYESVGEVPFDYAVTWLRQKGLLPLAPSVDTEEYDAWEQWADDVITQQQPALVNQLRIEQIVRPTVWERYQDSVSILEEALDQQECWRALTVPVSANPVEHSRLGTDWAYESEGADTYRTGPRTKVGKHRVVYRARIDLKTVDKTGTILANMIDSTPLSYTPVEHEVKFFKGVPIFVYDVELPDGTVLEIDDWRTT